MASSSKPPKNALRKLNAYISEPKKKAPKRAPRGASSKIPPASDEQNAIIEGVARGENIIVDANPGAGKTTTIFQIAYSFPQTSICQITFNKKLKMEVRAKADFYAIESLSSKNIHTYHSFAKHLYAETLAHTDEGIRMIVEEDREPVATLDYDIVIVDEVNDMRELLCVFIHKLLKDVRKSTGRYPQLILLGDKNQGVYEFLGSRVAFLTHAPKIFTYLQFTNYTLSYSFRLTDNMRDFTNNVLLGEKRIVTNKKGPKVGIITQNDFTKLEHAIASSILKAKIKYNLTDGDIAILAPTLHNKSGLADTPKMIHRLENLLVGYGYKVYFPGSDDTELDEKVIRNRVVFSAYPSSKGCEWKYVVVLGITGEYFNFFGKDLDFTKCPSSMYVALTRASQKLVIVCNSTVPPFFKIPRSSLYDCGYCGLEKGQLPIKDRKYEYDEPDKPPAVSVTRLVMYLTDKIQAKLLDMINPMYEEVDSAEKPLKIPSNISVIKPYKKSNGDLVEFKLWEYVADKTGNALMHFFDLYYQHNGGYTYLCERCADLIKEHYDHPHRMLLHTHTGEDVILEDITSITAASSIIDHYDSNTLSSPTIINDFGWISEKQAGIAMDRLSAMIDIDTMQREVSLEIQLKDDSGTVDLCGRIDVVCENNVWEIKCTNDISLSAKLQLMLYYYMWVTIRGKDKRDWFIYNVKTNQRLVLIPNMDVIEEIVNILVDCYFENKEGEPPEMTVQNAISHIRRTVGM